MPKSAQDGGGPGGDGLGQANKAAAHEQLVNVVPSLAKRFSEPAQLLADAEGNILAYMAFPSEHWRQLYSTNRKCLIRQIRRRTNVDPRTGRR